MKTIKILIAASEEMHEETLKFSELIANLNEVLEPRGIELIRVKWDPEADGSIEDYKRQLSDSEMCLTLFWQSLAENSQQELDTAYNELKNGNNPRKLYVFFKEPSKEIAATLKDFKANFVNDYGHFFCKFENADTMNLHFILQLEAYNNQTNNDLVKVSDGMVLVGGKKMAELKNVPFAALNKEYQRLQQELSSLDEEIAGISIQYATNTKDTELLKQLTSLSSKREKVSEEFEKYQSHLYDIALSFAKMSGEHYSERMRKARELFEKGNTVEADRILNLEEMKREAKSELKLLEQNIRNLETKVDEFRLKADTVMANTSLSIPDRFAEACEAYEEALSIAREIHIDEEKLADCLFDYAYLLQKFNRMHEALSLYQETINIFRLLASSNPDAYLPNVATILNNLGTLQRNLWHLDDAEDCYQEALEIYYSLAPTNSDTYLPNIAMTLYNLGALQSTFRRYYDAMRNTEKALDIYRKLASTNPSTYLPYTAMTLNSLGASQDAYGHRLEAEGSYREALDIYYSLASVGPDTYLPEIAMELNNLGIIQRELGRFIEATGYCQEALKVYRTLALTNPDVYLPYIATTLNNLGFLQRETNHYDIAENHYQEALELRRDLASTNPDAFLPDVATTLSNLGILQRDLGHFKKAEEYMSEALEVRQFLAVKNPDAFLPTVAVTFNNLGTIQCYLGLYPEAENSYQEALSILHSVTSTNPDLYLPDIALTLKNIGLLEEGTKNIKAAKEHWMAALDIYSQLEKKNPGLFVNEIEKLEDWIKDISQKRGLRLGGSIIDSLLEWFKRIVK